MEEADFLVLQFKDLACVEAVEVGVEGMAVMAEMVQIRVHLRALSGLLEEVVAEVVTAPMEETRLLLVVLLVFPVAVEAVDTEGKAGTPDIQVKAMVQVEQNRTDLVEAEVEGMENIRKVRQKELVDIPASALYVTQLVLQLLSKISKY